MELKIFQNEVVHRLFYNDPSSKSDLTLSPKHKRSKSTMRAENMSYEEFENRNRNYGMKFEECSFSKFMDRMNGVKLNKD